MMLEGVRLSEIELRKVAEELARELSPGDRVILEGPMGAGKSTFARLLLEALGVSDRQAGSPTFAIAHEYESRLFPVIHLDLYRMRTERELEDAGIPSYFWEREEAVVLVEWLSMFPEFEQEVTAPASGGRSNWRVSLDFVSQDGGLGTEDQALLRIVSLAAI